MADCIKVLPDIVANQIKAGEVVESPSSVVKEMMENAIDAGATEVTVNFSNGGRDLVQIIDNGRGMSPVDARMAFECHATSKIASLDDIYALHTFGFRGEALASIAAVSQVELLTRQADTEIGTRTIINGGEFVSQTPAAAPVGSQFQVRNLFYNTPARRNFINNKEEKLVENIKREFRRVALCHPDVACKLMKDGAPLYDLPASNLIERIVGVVYNSTRRNLLDIDTNTSIVKISGFIGHPHSARNNSSEQYMFVNGRYFRSPYLNKAVAKAYEKLIPAKAYPSFFLYLEVDPERVDVNVHAQKIEVKFADNDAIWQIINAAVREALAKTGAVPLIDFEAENVVDIPVAQGGIRYAEPRATTRENYNPFAEGYTDCVENDSAKQVTTSMKGRINEFDIASTIGGFDIISTDETEFDYMEAGESQNLMMDFEASRERPNAISLCGNRYAVATFSTKALIIDLVRANEQILFKHYLSLLEGATAASQQLLFPEELTLTEEEFDLIEEYAIDFAALGFDIKAKEGATIEVFGIPANISMEMMDKAIYDILQSLKLPQSAIEARRESIAQTLSHSEAVHRTNFVEEEIERIVNTLLDNDEYYTPQGKQIVLTLTTEDIKTKLG